MAVEPEIKRRRWPAVTAALLVVAGLVAAYWLIFYEMWMRWFPAWRSGRGLYYQITGGESYYTHGPLVPLVSLIIVILLVRHTEVPVRPRRGWGAVVLIGSLLVHLLACRARVSFVSEFTMIGVLMGLVLMFWGWTALRRLWFPVALLLFMVPLPMETIATLNFRLKFLAADWGVALAHLGGVIVERSGNTVYLEGDKSLVIANVCNGLRTLISLLAFGAIYAYVCKLRGGWRLVLFAMSVPVAIISNSIRIVSLIVVADIWDAETATGWYHDTSGILIYVVAFLMMFGLERLILAVRQAVGRPAEVLPLFSGVLRSEGADSQWPALGRAFGGVAAWVVVVLVAATAVGTYFLNLTVPSMWTQQMAARAMPATLNIDGHTWTGRDTKMDDAILEVLETRDYLLRNYSTEGSPSVFFCAVFSQDNRKGTHPPDLCLEGIGRNIVEKADVTLENVEGRGDVGCRSIMVQGGHEREYYLYVYKCGKRYTSSFWTQQAVIFVNGLFSRNASGALIRVSTPVGDDLEAAKRRCKAMLRTAIPYLDANLP